MLDKKDITFSAVKGGDQIAKMKGIRMHTSEGHLGGYILDGAAPGTWCPEIWDWAMNELGINSVMDIGCGLGYAAKYFQNGGSKVLGVEGSDYAIQNSEIKDSVIQHDYTTGPFIPEHKVDLVWSAEFIEHVEEKFSGNFLVSFCSASKFIMLTYAEPGQGGHHHVNEQPEEYWIEKLACINFELDPDLTAKARVLAGTHRIVGKHFRKRGLVFKKIS